MSETYQEGFQAFVDGMTLEDNPYDDAVKREKWDEGWEDAKIDKDSQRRSVCSET